MPPLFAKGRGRYAISLFVLRQFLIPKFSVAGRFGTAFARMTVPKAAMHKNGEAALPIYDIGSPRQFLCVQPVSDSYGGKDFSDGHFRGRVATADAGHQA
jgi:hypothetical protein